MQMMLTLRGYVAHYIILYIHQFVGKVMLTYSYGRTLSKGFICWGGLGEKSAFSM